MMVDWISGFVRASNWPSGRPLYDTGRIIQLDPEGGIKVHRADAQIVRGSHDSTILVKSPNGTDLYLSGNGAKYLQGHNLFGPSDWLGLYLSTGWRVREEAGLFPSPGTWHDLGFAGPEFTRIDLTRSYRFPSNPLAREFLQHVFSTARTRQCGAMTKGSTVYFQQNSTRWTFKAYCKADEINARGAGHKIRGFFDSKLRQLTEWTEGIVRFELTLRKPELQNYDLNAISPLELWEIYYGRIQMNTNANFGTMDMLDHNLPPRIRQKIDLWKAGVDLRKDYSRVQFYRIRKEVMELTGKDISVPYQPEVVSDRAAVLDPKGWDPEPIEAHMVKLDDQLKMAYR